MVVNWRLAERAALATLAVSTFVLLMLTYPMQQASPSEYLRIQVKRENRQLNRRAYKEKIMLKEKKLSDYNLGRIDLIKKENEGVAPKYKLMTCVIQKSMSTVMTAVLCFLFNETAFRDAGREFAKECSGVRFCLNQNEYNSIPFLKRKFNIKKVYEDGWRFTMITREPIDRFLSGYVDKCIRNPRESGYCNGCRRNITCFILTEYDRIMKQVNRGHLHRSFEDRHFFPQSWRCDLNKEYQNYNFIRYSSDPTGTLLEDLVVSLKKQEVPEESIAFISSELSKGRTVHSTVKSEARQFLEARVRSSPFLMEYLVRMFYHDFKLLHYPFPEGF